MLYAVDFDALVIFREALEMLPSLRVRFQCLDNPSLKNEMLRVEVRDYSESGRSHISDSNEPAATLDVLLAPVAALAPRREMLDSLAVVDAFHGAVYPAEAQSDFNCIHVRDHSRVRLACAVDANPESRHFVMMLQVPVIQFLA